MESSHEETDQPKMRNESTCTKRLVFKRAKISLKKKKKRGCEKDSFQIKGDLRAVTTKCNPRLEDITKTNKIRTQVVLYCIEVYQSVTVLL